MFDYSTDLSRVQFDRFRRKAMSNTNPKRIAYSIHMYIFKKKLSVFLFVKGNIYRGRIRLISNKIHIQVRRIYDDLDLISIEIDHFSNETI